MYMSRTEEPTRTSTRARDRRALQNLAPNVHVNTQIILDKSVCVRLSFLCLYMCVCVCVYIYIYIYICVCVCVCACVRACVRAFSFSFGGLGILFIFNLVETVVSFICWLVGCLFVFSFPCFLDTAYIEIHFLHLLSQLSCTQRTLQQNV